MHNVNGGGTTATSALRLAVALGLSGFSGVRDEGALRGEGDYETAFAEFTGGAPRGQMRDSILRSKVALPRQPSARPKHTLGNPFGNVIGHLHVDVRDLGRIDRRLP